MSEPRPTLDYVRARGGVPYSTPSWEFYRFALVLAVTPQVIGVIILFAYALSKASALPPLGFLWILIGSIIAGLAVLLALIYLLRIRRDDLDRVRRLRSGLILLGVALLNVPVGGICANLGLYLVRTYRSGTG